MVPSKWQNDFIYELSPIFTLGPKTTYSSTVTFSPNEVSLDKNCLEQPDLHLLSKLYF